MSPFEIIVPILGLLAVCIVLYIETAANKKKIEELESRIDQLENKKS